MSAPVCPISRSQPREFLQKFAPDVARIPYAHDLPSVINVINQINNVVQKITNETPHVNNIYNFPDPLKPPPVYNPASTWNENGRYYDESSSVKNPDNPDQEIKIKTISSVIFMDSFGHSIMYHND